MTGTTPRVCEVAPAPDEPQWSPVLMTGTTGRVDREGGGHHVAPQWSPVLMTGTTRAPCAGLVDTAEAAMEPRADDGDDLPDSFHRRRSSAPQWSPVLMTGTTGSIDTG